MGIDVSVIVPTCGRKEKLKKCLDSIFNQDFPEEKLEIIIVDDRSDPETAEIIDNFRQQHPRVLKYIAQNRKGPAAARNSGVKVSSADIIAFVDDDCTVDRDWIKIIMEMFRANPEAIAVGGHTFTSTQKIPALVSQFLSTCSIETHVNGKQEIIFFPTCNVSIRKEVFKEYAFSENFPFPGGEDLEFFWRLFKNGYRFLWNKNIKVIHHRDDTFSSFIKQAHIYGRGNLLAQHIHRDHPLLKELKTDKISFWTTAVINIMKIPRFSYLLGRSLIREHNIRSIYKQLSVYSYFIIHKIFYIAGNITEFFRIINLDQHKALYAIPRLLILDITHSCNLSCRICDIWKSASSEQDIDIAHTKKMLLKAKELGIKEIALSGGEPLLRKDIFRILDFAKDIKIKDLGILTNGILVEKYFDKLRPYLIDNTISLVISFDSLNSYTHNYIRNSDIAWQKTLESLRLSSMLKKECPQVNFNIITIILNKNLQELSDIAIFTKSLGANSLQFQTLLPNNLNMSERKESMFWVSGRKLPVLDEAVDRLIQFKQDNPAFIKNSINNLSLVKNYYRNNITSKDVVCQSAHKTVLISNMGECTTCFSCYGDIKNQELKDILKSREILAARERASNCKSPCLLPCFTDSA